MILKLIVAFLVLGIAYLWAMRGFFNALMHGVAVVVGGAIAFAVWEPVSLAIVNAAPVSGVGRVVGSTAWSIGLIVPFVVATLVVRVVLDKTVPANVKLARPAEYAGGGVCGLGIGILTVGILVIALGATRFNAGFMGYRPLWYNEDRTAGSGSLKLNDSLWIPADKLTASFYGSLSQRAFAAPEPLAKWYPDLHAVAYANRIASEKITPVVSIKAGDASIVGRYTVAAEGAPVSELLKFDLEGSLANMAYADANGEQVSNGSLAGYVLKFEAGAKDPGKSGAGQVIFSNGQARLVCQRDDGSTFNVFPVAMISQAASGDATYGRWRFDAEEVVLASVGGASTVTLGLEFVVPQGSEPIGLFVKNTRFDLDDIAGEPTAYRSIRERDRTVPTGGILSGDEPAPEFNEDNAVTIDPTREESHILISNQLGGRRAMHVAVAKRVMDVDDNNRITFGSGQWEPSDFSRPPTDRKLRVDRFAVGDGQVIVQVDMHEGTPGNLNGPVARTIDADEPIRLLDTAGQAYDAIGYIYNEADEVHIRYTPSDPLDGSVDLPRTLSSSRTDQTLRIVFLCSYGVHLDKLAIGDTVLLQFEPTLELDVRQN
ncbi:MAG: hypothetical protein DHS20C14_08920 [Phycisphaeraceae bacterium]|nr:MAG: hypothetical protein DHS20C14_08920 [Phycisphaeraceae bacterium]